MSKQESDKQDFLGIRLPKKLMQALDKYIELDTHGNRSDFVRTAIREKLDKEAPWIIRNLLKDPNDDSVSLEELQ